MTGIDATCQEDARFATIQIRCTEKMLGRTMAIAVSPSLFQIRFTRFQTLQGIIHHLIWLTCLTIQIYKKLRTLMNKPLTFGYGTKIILRFVANDTLRAISHVDDGAISSTHHSFGLSILIPVVGNNILFVVLEIRHIRAEVNPPKPLTIKLIAFNDEIFTLVSRLLIGGIRPTQIVKLQQNLKFTIPINISTTGIIRNISGL